MLNLPIALLKELEHKNNILISGIGGGFDVFAGLPLFFSLRNLGKNVHLANYSLTDFNVLKDSAGVHKLTDYLWGATHQIHQHLSYYPEGFLSEWFMETLGEEIPVWMIKKSGPKTVRSAYKKLIDNLGIDAIILVDSDMDSVIWPHQDGYGTILEDMICLASLNGIQDVDRYLVCTGMGTDVKNNVAYGHALKNISQMTQQGALFGSCSLMSFMNCFAMYANACEYVWNKPGHQSSPIQTQIISGALGAFGDYHMHEDDKKEGDKPNNISPLSNQYWFFDARAPIANNEYITYIEDLATFHEVTEEMVPRLQAIKKEPREEFKL